MTAEKKSKTSPESIVREIKRKTRRKFTAEEKRVILALDKLVRQKSARRLIDPMTIQVEKKLMGDTRAALAWESIPLSVYKAGVPNIILSSWVFAVRAKVNSGAERHPNSHQFMMSYRGLGDLQIQIEENWTSNLLISSLEYRIESRWISVPQKVWHRAIAFDENWIVISFHTASKDALVEERLDPIDEKLMHQRYYMNEKETAE